MGPARMAAATAAGRASRRLSSQAMHQQPQQPPHRVLPPGWAVVSEYDAAIATTLARAWRGMAPSDCSSPHQRRPSLGSCCTMPCRALALRTPRPTPVVRTPSPLGSAPSPHPTHACTRQPPQVTAPSFPTPLPPCFAPFLSLGAPCSLPHVPLLPPHYLLHT